MTEFTAYDELMPKIQALIAPGDSSSSKDKSSEHHFFRRKGKWHNHDCCDACGEKGKLLCCDICPASFHLLCHDPPLDVAHVPNGPWTCYACNNIRDKNNDPSKKSYKIEFVNGNNTSNSTREKKNMNSNKNVQKKDDQPSTKSLLYLSLCKPNSSPLAAENSSRSVNCKSTNCDSISAATVREKSFDSQEILSRTNPKHRTVQFETKQNNGSASSNMDINHEVDSNLCHIEIKTEPGFYGVDIEYDLTSNSNGRSLKRKLQNSFCEETVNKSNHEVTDVIKDRGGSNSSINILGCDFLSGKPTPAGRSEARISSMEKSYGDKNNISDIEKVFNVIVSETKKLNPRQFALPKEYIANIDGNLLKPEKESDISSRDWDSNDLLKIPARRCYFCNGICLSGQMISCDFCPTHFHLNCLDPPMCSAPNVRWMCPLHPHHILEKVMNNPNSISELSAWWQDFSEPIDPKEVISKFVKKINRQRKKTAPVVVNSVKIPDIVKYHYKYPVRYIPAPSEITRGTPNCLFEDDFTFVPHELIMKTTECCSRPLLQYGKFDNQTFTTVSLEKENIVPVNEIPRSVPSFDPESLIEITSDDKEDSVDAKLEEARKNGENLSTWDLESKSFRFKSFGIYDFEPSLGPVQRIIPQISKSPWQKIEEIIDRNVDANLILGGLNCAKLNPNLKRLIINEELQAIVNDLPPSFLPGGVPYPFTPPVPNNNSIPKAKSPAKVHAVLCPLSHRAPMIFMHDGTLSIGTDFSNDVCLLNYGYCNFISGEHAVIFYDKLSKTYEVLNYSEFSTVVDGVAYTCDISSPTEPAQKNPSTSVINKVNSAIDEKTVKKSTNKEVLVEEVDEPTEKFKSIDSSVAPSISRTKSSGLESRNLFKKLMGDIDKLILRSKKEMASIAEDDLAEIARASRASSETNRTTKDSATDKSKGKKKSEFSVQLKRFDTDLIDLCDEDSCTKSASNENLTSANLKSSCENESQPMNESSELFSNPPPPPPDPAPPSVAQPVANKEAKSTVLYQTETTTLRRSERKIKRSIFSTYRREMRKDKKLELDMLGSDSDEEVKTIARKEAPSLVASVEDASRKNDNRHPNNDRFVPATKAKCRCQINNANFPDGMDRSWENSAALHHGSHIRFGCVEFVFSVVNYQTEPENRTYQRLRKSPSSRAPKCDESRVAGAPPEAGPSPAKRAKKAAAPKDEDLSSKLRSLLSVLSSTTKSSSSKSSNSSAANSSPRTSPESSRSPSPRTAPDLSSLIEVNYEESDHVRHEIKTEDS